MNAVDRRQAMLKNAHSPQARQKAGETNTALMRHRYDLARKYGGAPTDYVKAKLVHTVARHHVPVSAIPELMLSGLSAKDRKALLAKRGGNGHDMSGGVGIPLAAIPERRPNAAHAESKPRGPYNTNRGHPNAQLIEKVIDLLAKPELQQSVVDRLVIVLDKLIA